MQVDYRDHRRWEAMKTCDRHALSRGYDFRDQPTETAPIIFWGVTLFAGFIALCVFCALRGVS